MKKSNIRNSIAIVILTLCLGAFVGLILWLFLQVVSLGTTVIWKIVPNATEINWIVIPMCAIGGCVVGLLHKKYGNYPESLDKVMTKVKQDKHYDYKYMLPMLICAVIPLIFGSSVGPEAGLTGIIAALCYWIGDNLKIAKQNADVYSEIGEAVTLGQLFHMPLFGILIVEEQKVDEEKPNYPKGKKLALYALSTIAGIVTIYGLNYLFNVSMEGFPKFSKITIHIIDYAMMLVYIPVGIIMYLIYEVGERVLDNISDRIPMILKETICGICIGIMGCIIPMVLFSGEEEMAELMNDFGKYAPWYLIGIAVIKLIMTAFSLSFGMRGGHFFPLIFACTCMAYGLTGVVFSSISEHVVFAAGIITAATLGAQLKKPLVVAILLLLCFPARMLFWVFAVAAISGRVGEMIKNEYTKQRN